MNLKVGALVALRITWTSRGEVGLIVAGITTAAGVISPSIYSVIVLMVVVTTIIPPLLLKRMAKTAVSTKELPVNNRRR